MPITSGKRLIGHYARRLAGASLCAAVAACAARAPATAAASARLPFAESLIFENATTETVTLHLAEGGSEWFIGQARPGETAVFRLPWTIARPADRRFSLVAVPSSARRRPVTASAVVPGPVRAEPLPGGYLTSVRWRLTGGWLVSLPLRGVP